MLCLSRKSHETIQIGDEITLTILSINSQQIRFGIDAPRDIPVMREEILEREAGAAWHQMPGNSSRQAESVMSGTPHDQALHMVSSPDDPIFTLEEETIPKKPKPKIVFKRRKMLPNQSLKGG
jgi:carbon storage regulator